MASVKHPRLRAATLLEVIVAMVMIMLIFGIAMMVYLNVVRSSFTERQLAATQLLKQISMETTLDKSFFDEAIERNGIRVIKVVRRYKDFEHLIHLHLETEEVIGNTKISHDRLIGVSDEKD